MEHWEDDSLKVLAEDLIANYHSHLGSAKIAYLFREKAQKKKLTLSGEEFQVVPGNVSMITPGSKYKVLTGKELVIEIGHDTWQEYTSQQKRYVMDTLLSTICGEEDEETGDMVYFLIPFPVSFFPDVVRRQGLVFDSLRDVYGVMVTAHENETKQTVKTVPANQLGLPFEDSQA
jgi:hypothetical protein